MDILVRSRSVSSIAWEHQKVQMAWDNCRVSVWFGVNADNMAKDMATPTKLRAAIIHARS